MGAVDHLTGRVGGLKMLLLSFFAYLAWGAIMVAFDRKIAEEGGDVELVPGEKGGGAGSRLVTLLPFIRNFLLILLSTIVVMMILVEMGVNVGPIFAGPGIVGLAIGFGAQTLVKDIISGVFFLIDDAFRKGEYIDIGSVKGSVERISLRSMQLRHHNGPIHTVPFGEIGYVTNFSRDWVMMMMPLRLTYDTDSEMVRKMIKKLGEEMKTDPVLGPMFLQPLKSQGVIQMEDSAMIMRVKFMTRPGDQWDIRRIVFAKIRDLFEENGIKFANREVTVRLADDEKTGALDEATSTAVRGSAARLIQDDVYGGRRS
jgi:small-conductance mechanosensitive channel